MIARIMLATAAALLVMPAAVNAQEVEYDQIEKKNLDSGKATLSPDKAYIYVTGPNRTNGIFLKTPDADDIAEYEAEWREEFADEQRKYPNRVRSYERKLKIWSSRKRGAAPEKPVEPTEESFSIGDIAARMIVPFGPQFVFDKPRDADGEKTFSYLIEVEPGTYSYYGPIFYAPGAAPLGLCYCMGSVKFEAAAGQVTSLGDFLAFEWVTTEAAKQAAVNATVERTEAEAKPVDYSVPSILAEFGAVPADLRAAGKMNNIFGIMIGRLPPIEGVLAYERDTPIDVKGQLALEAEAKAKAEAEARAAEAEADAMAAAEAEVEAAEDTAEAEVEEAAEASPES